MNPASTALSSCLRNESSSQVGELCWGGSCEARHPPLGFAVAVPPLGALAAAGASQWEIFPSHRQRGGRAAAERSPGWGRLPGGSSAASSTAPRSLRCILQVQQEDTLATWGGFPRHPGTCRSVTKLASVLHEARSGRGSAGEVAAVASGRPTCAARSRGALTPARVPARRPPGGARSAPLLPSGAGACPPARPPLALAAARSPPPPRAPSLAHAHAAAGQPSALSWRRGAAPVGTGAVPRASAGRSVAVASSAPPQQHESRCR